MDFWQYQTVGFPGKKNCVVPAASQQSKENYIDHHALHSANIVDAYVVRSTIEQSVNTEERENYSTPVTPKRFEKVSDKSLVRRKDSKGRLYN